MSGSRPSRHADCLGRVLVSLVLTGLVAAASASNPIQLQPSNCYAGNELPQMFNLWQEYGQRHLLGLRAAPRVGRIPGCGHHLPLRPHPHRPRRPAHGTGQVGRDRRMAIPS